jgi:hypothetical protein
MAASSLALASSGIAATVTFNFGSLPIGGTLCATDCIVGGGTGLHDIFGGGVELQEQGYNSSDAPAWLTQKPSSVNPADESGLGQSTRGTGPSDRDFEIQPREFTLLNERIAEAHGWTPTSLSISSIQRGDGAIIYGYNGPEGSGADLIPSDLVKLGTLTGAGGALQAFSVIGHKFDAYLVTASTGDVLVYSETLTKAIPEPATWALMALGFAGLGFVGFRQTRPTPRSLA